MFFNGRNGGKCPAGGGKHQWQGYDFILPYGAATASPAQDNWRYCQNCEGMFYNGRKGGVCPAGGGPHVEQPGGYNFLLPYNIAATATSQNNWRYCWNCEALVFAGRTIGKCPRGGPHVPQSGGYDFVLPYQDPKANQTQALQVIWNGIQLISFPNDVVQQFATGFIEGFGGQVTADSAWVKKLTSTITLNPFGFFWGYCLGELDGLITGLKNLLTSIVDLFKLAKEVFIPTVFAVLNPAGFILNQGISLFTDRRERELKEMQLKKAQAFAAALKFVIEDLARHPNSYVAQSRQIGKAIGASTGLWLTADLAERSAKEVGKTIGNVAGQVLFEVILIVVTEGIGEVAEAARASARFSRLTEVLRAELSRLPGVRRLIEFLRTGRRLSEEEEIINEAIRAVDRGAFTAGEFRQIPFRIHPFQPPPGTWKALKSANGLPQEFASVWRSCSNAQAVTDLAEVRRLWSLGDSASQQKAYELGTEVYGKWRDRFWRKIASSEGTQKDLVKVVGDAGFEIAKPGNAPRLRGADAGQKGLVDSLAIDHIVGRKIDPTRCVDPENLEFMVGFENSATMEQLRGLPGQ
jgi:hypothetical protein